MLHAVTVGAVTWDCNATFRAPSIPAIDISTMRWKNYWIRGNPEWNTGVLEQNTCMVIVWIRSTLSHVRTACMDERGPSWRTSSLQLPEGTHLVYMVLRADGNLVGTLQLYFISIFWEYHQRCCTLVCDLHVWGCLSGSIPVSSLFKNHVPLASVSFRITHG